MKVKEKIMLDRDGLSNYGPINIVIFGDSVSQGSFNDYMDYERVYWNVLKKKLNAVRSYVPVNMICSAIGGINAKQSLPRLESQVLAHSPDLVIVCFGLNDINGALEDYLSSLEEIFKRCTDAGCDIIFMTPNMLNTYVADDTPKAYLSYAAKMADYQNSGRMDEFVYSAIELAKRMNITVCDCYSEWKELAKTIDITLLLDNRINHPTPEMHVLFADSLFEILIEKEVHAGENSSTMYEN